MFALFISMIAIFLVLALCVATVNAVEPEQLNNVLYLISIVIAIPFIMGFISYIKNKKHYKKVIEEKQKKVKMLREYEVKDYVIECLNKNEIHLKNVKDVIEILKIGKTKRDRLEKDIVTAFQKSQDEQFLKSIQPNH